jgi:O-antigen ligase
MLSQKIHRLPTAWLVAFTLLSAAPDLRLGDVQLLEIFQLLRLLIVVLFFAWIGLKLPRRGALREYGLGYGILLIAALVLAVMSLRLPFYPPPAISLFKKPFVLSASRILELFLAIYFMLAVVETLRADTRLLRIALDAYAAIGALSAIASIAALAIFQATGANIFPVDDVQRSFLINSLNHRVCGFFNEGGPYGLFLASVFLMILLRRRLFPYRHKLPIRLALLCVSVAFLLSASKAGMLAIFICGAVMALFSQSRKRMLVYSLLPIGCLVLLAFFQAGLFNYAFVISNFDELLPYNSENPNVVMGRIIAFFVIPRMIAAHPLLGIGLGNYSLMRNDPNYLQGLPAINDWDLPGLGLVSYAAELGVPLALFLVALLLRPFWQSRKQRAPAILVASAMFQPVAAFLGVNMNFFYPWLVAGFALSSLEIGTLQRSVWPGRVAPPS